ncbi:MAG: signal peptidase II [Nitrospinota bacterium]|nr:signal peptidase II [Nitrospinota bacterium]
MSEESNAPKSGAKTVLTILAVVVVLVAADQYTKGLIEERFTLGSGVNVIPGFFDIVYVKNRGAAFGILAGVKSEWVMRGFLLFTVVAMGMLVWLYNSFGPEERLGRVSTVMIGAGAIGNFIDRLREGSVTDFLLFYIGEYQWPAFNVADSLITVGVAILALSIVMHNPEEGSKETVIQDSAESS